MVLFSRPVLSGILASGLSGYLLAIFMTYLAPFLDLLGTAAFIVGIILFSRNFFQIFLRIPLSEISQIIGRRPLIILGNIFYTMAFLLLYLSADWKLVFVATVFVAVGMACYWPSMFAYIGDISSDDYGKINGYIFMGSDMGIIIGTSLVSYALNNDILDLRGVFLWSLLSGLIGSFVIYFTLSEVIKDRDRQTTENLFAAFQSSLYRTWHSFKTMTSRSPLWLIYLFQFTISFTEYFFSSLFGIFVIRAKGYTAGDLANIILYSTVIVFFLKPYLGSISDKWGFKYPAMTGLLFNAVIIFSLTQVNSFILILSLYTLLSATSLTTYLAVNGATSYASPSQLRGLAMGTLGSYVSLGRSTSSLVVTPVWQLFEDLTGDRGEALIIVFKIISVVIILAVFVLYALTRRVDLSQYQKNVD